MGRFLEEGAHSLDDVAGTLATLRGTFEGLLNPPRDWADLWLASASAAYVLVSAAAMGWLTSCANEAVSCPIVETRLAWCQLHLYVTIPVLTVAGFCLGLLLTG